MPSTGTRKAKAKTKEKEKASNGVQHANLQRAIQTRVGTAGLQGWTLIQKNIMKKFNANCVGEKGILHKIAGNSGHGRTIEIHRFSGLLQGFVRLQKVRQTRQQHLQQLHR